MVENGGKTTYHEDTVFFRKTVVKLGTAPSRVLLAIRLPKVLRKPTIDFHET